MIILAFGEFQTDIHAHEHRMFDWNTSTFRVDYLSTADVGEFACPELTIEELGGYLVTKEYCESFGLGKGCKNCQTCKIYNSVKGILVS